MQHHTLTSALALCAMSAPAFADLTPREAWDAIHTTMEGYGGEITVTETEENGTLSISDMTFAFAIPEENMTVEVTYPEIVFDDNGDGAVLLTMPETSELSLRIFDGDGQVFEAVLEQSASEFSAVISGAQDDLVYSVDSGVLSYRLTHAVITDLGEDITLAPDMLNASFEIGPITGNSSLTSKDGMWQNEQDFSYGNVTYDLAFKAPEDRMQGTIKGFINDLSITAITTFSEGLNTMGAADIFKSGLMLDMALSYGVSGAEFMMDEQGKQVEGSYSDEGVSYELAFAPESLHFDARSKSTNIEVQGPDLPMPMEFSVGEAGFGMTMPLGKAETPQKASLHFNLTDYSFPELLWSMFDPMGNLPHEPATIALAVDAEITPLVDLFNEADMMAMQMEGNLPALLHSVTLKELLVSAVGGEITGEGGFAFDNSDLESFDGMPRPEGAISFNISGANGLLDSLVKMGLIPEDDVMGMRMMMAMFTVPGDEPDTMSTKLEVNPEGHVLANGQRLK